MTFMFESLIRPADLSTFVRNVPQDQSYTLNSILPDRIIDDVQVDVAEATVTARIAAVREFDAPAIQTGRDGFNRNTYYPRPVTSSKNLGELDLRRIALANARGGSDAATINAIYDDAANCTKEVLRRVEVMRGDALADGVITINENNVVDTVDFKIPSGNVATAGTLWSDPTATILNDLRVWTKNYYDLNGFRPGGIMMSEDIWYYMAANNQIKALYPNQGVAAPIVSADQVDNALRAYRLPPILMTYDARYSDASGNSQRVLPNNKVWFLPPAGIELGYTAWALTVTGREAAQNGQIPFSAAAGLVGVATANTAPPYQKSVYVDSCPLPVITNPRMLAIYTVAS